MLRLILLLALAAPAAAQDTAWIEAVRDNRLASLRSLLTGMAAVDLATPRGQTALHLAVIGGPQDLVRRLLERGASPDTADSQGRTPRSITATLGRQEWLKTPPWQ